MHAMLALGSLQMAKLQGLPATAAMKHYHLSLRRIARNYQSNYRRLQPATLAATLLLGFYEVWNSDHDKWCKHMWGARAIFREIPLQDMTREILALKRIRAQRQHELQNQGQWDDFYLPLQAVEMDQIDTGLIAQITGLSVNYEGSGRILDGLPKRTYTERDIEKYEHLSDLFWWFCKMDVYQSVLGGTRLL
jgi:Fungal specific transcription factor domain